MVDRDLETSPPGFGDACSSIARAIADSLDLEQILTRVASAVRLVVPVDAMGIWHAEAPDDAVVLTLGPGAPRARGESDRPLRRADHSSRLWPETGGFPVVVGDAARELDLAYAGDRALVEYGYRAALVLALGSDTRQLGVLWLVHRQPNVYGPSHARALQPIADLATLAVEHDLLQALTQERRQKQEALEALLPTLARALDVQAVFAQISEVTRTVLAHDYLTLGLLTPDGRGFKMHASSLGVVSEAPEYRVTSEREADAWQWDFYIARDYTVLPDDSVRAHVMTSSSSGVARRGSRPPSTELRRGCGRS
jgi:GAF domain-containing protein